MITFKFPTLECQMHATSLPLGAPEWHTHCNATEHEKPFLRGTVMPNPNIESKPQSMKLKAPDLEKVGEKVNEAFSSLSHEATDLTHKGMEIAREQYGVIKDEAAAALKSGEELVRQSPLKALAIAFGIGFVAAGAIGFTFSRSMHRA
jgi:ElaB/YqjD/DUF883 family membrane-anchored ribosome-binding protein